MRKQFVETVTDIVSSDKMTILLLGDIGIYGFTQGFLGCPNRVFNVGILEQSMISMAAGLSLAGMTPIIHTIAPFLVERAFEQLKIDFGYQKVGGNFVSIGASYDYASLGATHHCPADVNVLKNIPNMEIVVCGHSAEFDALFRQAYSNGNPTYFRLSDYENKLFDKDVKFGKASIVKKGSLATIIAVGNLLDEVFEACSDMDVTILYYTTIAPFDFATLRQNCDSGKILLCEPYYKGGLLTDIINNTKMPLKIDCVGVPLEFSKYYGSKKEHDVECGITSQNIRAKLENLING